MNTKRTERQKAIDFVNAIRVNEEEGGNVYGELHLVLVEGIEALLRAHHQSMKTEISILRMVVRQAKNCLVGHGLVDKKEACESTLDILNKVDD